MLRALARNQAPRTRLGRISFSPDSTQLRARTLACVAVAWLHVQPLVQRQG
jgi:hypothetical protein